MANFKPLCSYCQQINFDTLRGPTTGDVEQLAAGAAIWTGPRLAQARPETTVVKVGLGTLERIRKDALECPLCALFNRIISRQGAVYKLGSTYESLDSNDIQFVADPDLSYYAKIGGHDTATTAVFVLRRLSLTAHTILSPHNPIAYLDHVLQFCDINILSASVQDPTKPVPQKPERTPFEGRFRPPLLDIQLAREWKHICVEQHGPLCSLDSAQLGSTHVETFRLIDVHQRSIHEFYNPKLAKLEFVALSYVWGPNSKIRLSKANKSSLQDPGALDGLQIPQTIADSMELVGLLGFRFLWVDALCIVQDDTDDQAYQIGEMDIIYSSTFLTIVAASGDDSNADLSGFGSSVRLCEQQEVLVIPPSKNDNGLSVMNTVKSCPRHFDEWYTRGKEDADSSKWSQRAWTMQEKALSRRTLVCTDEQVFWGCQQGYFCEESYFEIPKLRVRHFYPSVHRLGIHQLTGPNVDPWQLYENLVNNYMLRDMTYEGDVHVAIQGILDFLETSIKGGFLWGFPLSRFELALLWETFHGVSRRTALTTYAMTSSKKQVEFPSWTWMGWNGDIHCRVSEIRMER